MHSNEPVISPSCEPAAIEPYDFQTIDRALLRLNVDAAGLEAYDLQIQSAECYECPYVSACNVSSASQLAVDTRWPIIWQTVRHRDHKAFCGGLYHFGERGEYNLTFSHHNSLPSCEIVVERQPINSFIPIYIALASFTLLYLLYWTGLCVRKHYGSRSSNVYNEELLQELVGSNEVFEDDPPPSPAGQSTTEGRAASIQQVSLEKSPTSKPHDHSALHAAAGSRKRLLFLDTFRGLSIVLMIFVNYGGGGYWFFSHAAWNGVTVADLLFPWSVTIGQINSIRLRFNYILFMFIMGTSIALSFESLAQRQVRRLTVVYKVVRRSAILFCLGMFFVNHATAWSTLRVMGVLQRLAVAYLVVALMRCATVTPAQLLRDRRATLFDLSGLLRQVEAATIDVWWHWAEWLVMVLVTAAWCCATFLVQVPGCPKGYLGAGGYSGGRSATDLPLQNCTGGAAGYIDQLLLGPNHTYQHPSCKALYGCVGFDPEGLLGCLTAIVGVFLGMQTGNIFVVYERAAQRVVRLVAWAAVELSLAALLCGATQNDGAIPVNKNLWSLSFVLLLTGLANLLVVLLYLVCDVAQLWAGEPFYFVGMNPIVLYVGHECFESYLPVQWQLATTVGHAGLLAMLVWGAALWTLLAYYMHCQHCYIAV